MALADRIGADIGALDVVLARDRRAGRTSRCSWRRSRPGTTRGWCARCATARTSGSGGPPHGDGHVLVGRGLAGRWEMAFEVEPAARGAGLGRRLAAAAAGLVPAGELIWAQVSPGHPASLRAVLAAGYRPVCAEVLLPRPSVSREGSVAIEPVPDEGLHVPVEVIEPPVHAVEAGPPRSPAP